MFQKNLFKIIYLTLFLTGFTFSLSSSAAGGSSYALTPANTDIHDKESLKNGFATFVKNCVACHSAKLIRYSRIGADLDLSDNELNGYMYGEGVNKNSTILTKMSATDAMNLFGITAPDLSLTARVKGQDWIYTFLRSFYYDDSKKFKANNHLFVGTAMPNALGHFQGISDEVGKIVSEGILTTEQYDNKVRDLVNFMSYIAEPIKPKRLEMGVKVIVFLLFLLFFFYLLNREYWQDIKKN